MRSRRAVTALLQGPGVAVRVTEVGEARVVATLRIQPRAPSAGPGLDRVLVADWAHRDAAGDESCPLGRQLRGDPTQVAHPVGRVRGDQLYRTRRPGRSELHNPEFGGGMVVDVEDEAGPLRVEGECPVDVRDRQGDDLQREHHRSRGASDPRGRRRKSRIAAAISPAWVSSAKWPVSRKRTTAPGMSCSHASPPAGRKNGSFLPHTARKGGLWVRKYF